MGRESSSTFLLPLKAMNNVPNSNQMKNSSKKKLTVGSNFLGVCLIGGAIGLGCLIGVAPGANAGEVSSKSMESMPQDPQYKAIVTGANSTNINPVATKQMKAWLEMPEINEEEELGLLTKEERKKRKEERKKREKERKENEKKLVPLFESGAIDLNAEINSHVGKISIKHYLVGAALKKWKFIFNGWGYPEDSTPVEVMYRHNPKNLEAAIKLKAEGYFLGERMRELSPLNMLHNRKSEVLQRFQEGDFFECVDVLKLQKVESPEIRGYAAKVIVRGVSFESHHGAGSGEKKPVARFVEVKNPVWLFLGEDDGRIVHVEITNEKEVENTTADPNFTVTTIK